MKTKIEADMSLGIRCDGVRRIVLISDREISS